MQRLTPSNDDLLWVHNAKRDHHDVVLKPQSRGVEVVELHDLLAETLALPGAKDWLLDRKIIANEVGLGLMNETRSLLNTLENTLLADYLIGGLCTRELPPDFRNGYIALAREFLGINEYLMPPLPNTLYTRDTTSWIYGGVTLNQLYWPARHDETLIMKTIYQFHPDYNNCTIWWGDPEQEWGQATLEGGDMMPVGNGAVPLIGMSERASRQAITQLAKNLVEAGAVQRVVIAGMPKRVQPCTWIRSSPSPTVTW